MTPPPSTTARSTAAPYAALSASAAWLLATFINQVVAAVGTGPLGAGLQPLLPSTVPSWVSASAAPWQFLIPLAAALALGAGLLAVLPAVLRPADPGRGGPPAFLATWCCVVLASAGVGGLLALGGMLADWPPARWSFLLREVQPLVGAAAYWGLVWGWLPAWVGTALVRREAAAAGTPPGDGGTTGARRHRGRPSPRSARVVLVALPAIALAVVLVAFIPMAKNANQAHPAPIPAAEPVPEPVAIGHPTVSYDVEDGAPGSAHPEAGTWCRGADVHVELGGIDAATGHRGQLIRITNTSAASCRLGAYPDVAFDDPAGNAMNVLFYRGGSFMTDDAGPARVVLAPGKSATASMGWNAMASAGATTPGTLLVAPYAGTHRLRLPVGTDIAPASGGVYGADEPGGLVYDIVDGGAVALSAWAAEK